jgi:3'-5' exoribonuclease
MKVYLADLRLGEPVETALMVVEKRLVPFRDQAKGHYLVVALVDRTGQIEGRAWDNAAELAKACEPGDVVWVTGVVEEYRENRQLRVGSLRRLEAAEVELADFLAVTPRDRRAMEQRLDDLVASVQDPQLSSLLTAFFGDPEFRYAFCEAPAAKRIHHNYLGGLLEHSLEVAEVVETAARFAPEVKGGLNRDLALAGALLHDIGKLREYRYRPFIDLTDEGKLVGHTVLGVQMLRERLAGLGSEAEGGLVLELEHLILTHHGELEWGAPILPHTVEAAAVHYADLLSGRVKQYQQVAAGGGGAAGATGANASEEPAWSPYDNLLGRSLYLGGR